VTGAEERTDRDIGRLAEALGDPTRRRIFFTVRSAGRQQSKDDVAAAVGIDRRLAGFHLDKLVEYGFLEAEFRRAEGRGGPGAGRPPKLYRLADSEVLVALPERHYDLLASLLLRATRAVGDGTPQEVLERVGHDFGFEVGLAEVAAGAHLRPRPRDLGRHAGRVRARRHAAGGGDARRGPRGLRGDGGRPRPALGLSGQSFTRVVPKR
jgi:DNA-binding transcriptional ArsR family regulator